MVFRIFLTFAIVLVALGLNFVWQSFEAPVTGQAAVLQLDDSMAGYALAKRASEHIPQKVINIGGVALLALIWLPVLVRHRAPSSITTRTTNPMASGDEKRREV